MIRALAVGAVIAGVTASILPLDSATRAGAQSSSAADALVLVSQDPSTPLGGDLHVRIRTPVTVATVGSISVVAHQAVTSRSSFDRTINGQSLGSVLGQLEVPLSALPPDEVGTRDLTVGLQAPTGTSDPARLGVRRAGVYPLEVELRDENDRTSSSFVTYLVATDPADTTTIPLGVAWVWPLDAAPATLPDGTTNPEVEAELHPDGRLGRQAAALRRATDMPLTIVPGPETLEAWHALGQTDPSLASGADAVVRSTTHAQVITSSYVSVNLPSLLAAGLSPAADAELVAGYDALTEAFGRAGDTRTALAQPIDPDSLTRLRARGVDRVIVDSSALAESTNRFTLASPFTLQGPSPISSESSAAAAANDDELALLLGGNADPGLRVQRFLAGLSVVALEQPNRTRGVVVVNPEGFDGSTAVIDGVLNGLRTNPQLKAISVNDFFDQVPLSTGVDGGATRTLADQPIPAPPVAADAFASTQDRLDDFRSLAGSITDAVTRAEHSLLLSVSSRFTGNVGAATAQAHLAAVGESIDAFVAKIRVPNPDTITLTARSGDIPLTFRNDTGQAVSVQVTIESPKLSFPNGPTRTVELPPRSTTVRIAVEARTSGSFPLRLVVTSADGRFPIADGQFRVRSTVVSAVGIVLTAGAVAFLAVWWLWHIRRRRHPRSRKGGVAPEYA